MKRHLMWIIVMCICVAVAVPNATAASYRKELKKATERGRMYDTENGNAKIIFDATLFTNDFRRAFGQKDADIRHLEPTEAARSLAEQMEKQAVWWEVFVSMYTRKEYKDYSLTPNTFWSSYITTEYGDRVYPVRIEKVDVTPYWKVMFPKINRWAKAYRVLFPKVELGKKASFTLQSVVGKRTITWKVD